MGGRLLFANPSYEFAWLDIECLCNIGDYIQRSAIHFSFESADVSSINACKVRQLFLRDASKPPVLLQILSKDFSNVHLRALPEMTSI